MNTRHGGVVITHEFIDHLDQFIEDCSRYRNSKLIERVIEYLDGGAKMIDRQKRMGQEDTIFVLQAAGEARLKTLRERADFYEEKRLREEAPPHVPERHLTEWLGVFRIEYDRTSSVGMANLVADRHLKGLEAGFAEEET